MKDFTVYEEIYADGLAFCLGENVTPVEVLAYEINLAEVLAYDGGKLAGGVRYATRGITDETFKAGEDITKTAFSEYVRIAVEGSAPVYADFLAYEKAHRGEMKDPCRHLRVVVNNPNCFPSGEEQRRKQGEELGRYLGRVLGIGKRQ